MQGLAHREGGVRPGVRPPCPGVIPLQRSTRPYSGHPHISGGGPYHPHAAVSSPLFLEIERSWAGRGVGAGSRKERQPGLATG
eukprot:5180696-Prymnesium_polylepis.1